MSAYDQKKKQDGQIELPGLTQKEKDARRRLKRPSQYNEPAKPDSYVERKPRKTAGSRTKEKADEYYEGVQSTGYYEKKGQKRK